jgi:hypothetical protein
VFVLVMGAVEVRTAGRLMAELCVVVEVVKAAMHQQQTVRCGSAAEEGRDGSVHHAILRSSLPVPAALRTTSTSP